MTTEPKPYTKWPEAQLRHGIVIEEGEQDRYAKLKERMEKRGKKYSKSIDEIKSLHTLELLREELARRSPEKQVVKVYSLQHLQREKEILEGEKEMLHLAEKRANRKGGKLTAEQESERDDILSKIQRIDELLQDNSPD